MLDLALPMLVSTGARMVAVHVPSHYVFDAHPRRAVYLARLQDEDRLALVAGLERGAVSRRCLWLLIFRGAAEKGTYLMAKNIEYTPLHFLKPALVLAAAYTMSSGASGRGGRMQKKKNKAVTWAAEVN